MKDSKTEVSAKRLCIVTAVIVLIITILTALPTPMLVQRFYPIPEDQGPA